MKLTWTVPAIADRLAIYEWLELKNPAAAAENDAKIADAAARLVHHPTSGKTGRIAGTRELVISPSYLLVYELAAQRVIILAAGGRRHSHPRSPSCSFSAFK
ncbi:type II toxin-antitoxin system RelE/ParE family toxin [Serratia marcescens]|uniref:type II toxin-antitoxin system RelE/ParE family toxin n=1 Tax=Serratia marcescens TaxID=615 RepID=UPI0002B867EA|nr:type II toxin-antitoxin system RelE/ParE family toxin [Serratia marcescens]EMF06942.1 addiction module antitoxin [Serratia marcescens VGH107]